MVQSGRRSFSGPKSTLPIDNKVLFQLLRYERIVLMSAGEGIERIARIIGVSQVQVSRIEKKALGLLRQYF